MWRRGRSVASGPGRVPARPAVARGAWAGSAPACPARHRPHPAPTPPAPDLSGRGFKPWAGGNLPPQRPPGPPSGSALPDPAQPRVRSAPRSPPGLAGVCLAVAAEQPHRAAQPRGHTRPAAESSRWLPQGRRAPRRMHPPTDPGPGAVRSLGARAREVVVVFQPLQHLRAPWYAVPDRLRFDSTVRSVMRV